MYTVYTYVYIHFRLRTLHIYYIDRYRYRYRYRQIYTLEKPGPKNQYSWKLEQQFFFEGLSCPDFSRARFFQHLRSLAISMPCLLYIRVASGVSDISRLLWMKKSCTSWQLSVTIKQGNGINHLPTGAGFRNHPQQMASLRFSIPKRQINSLRNVIQYHYPIISTNRYVSSIVLAWPRRCWLNGSNSAHVLTACAATETWLRG